MSTQERAQQTAMPSNDSRAWEVLNAIEDSCFVVNETGAVEFANAAAGAYLGVSPDAIVGRRFVELISEHSRSAMQEAIAACVAHRSTHAVECDLDAAGRNASALIRVSPCPATLAAGRCVLVGRDVGNEKAKDLDLLRFANVAHYTVNPLEITDTGGKIVYVNPAFEKASGFSRDELIGKNPSVFGSGKYPKTFWAKMWQTITAGRVWVGEIENKRRDGEPFFTQILISPIIDSTGAIVGYFGIHRDITHVRHLEQQLVHAQKMESIGMLAAGLAHEVGNPLTSISSIVQVIQRTTQDEFAKDKLALIKSQIHRISKIIRELVDFARQSSYELVMTDINRTITDAVDIVRMAKKARDIAFRLELDEMLPQIPLVPDKVQQVLINILINAVDAMQDRSADRKQEGIAVRSGVADDNIVIDIHDSGTGIPADAIPKIFDPFFTTKPVGEGTGLGLWVSYTIVKSFDGDIRVTSNEDEGTTFSIVFPQLSTRA